MDQDIAAQLRAPFADQLVGKLPRIWCGACRDARGKVCEQHRKAKCSDCGNNITSAHLHLDYVGHADVTDRLLQVDPSWTWEPLALDQAGLPAVDSNGGLWIRLTVAGVTRLGYGHADGKRGGDAVKEAIGDAIRNAGLRFGVAIDLWRKEPPPAEESSAPAAARAARTASKESAAARPPARQTQDDPDLISPEMRKAIMARFGEHGLGGGEHRDQRMDITRRLSGVPDLKSTSDLGRAQGRQVLDGIADACRALAQRQEATP